MILREIDKETIDTLNLDITNITVDWNYYYEQYKHVLCFLVRNESIMGIRFMSFLFIFRHTVELFLKQQISNPKTTHSLSELFKEIKGLPNDFLIQLEVLRCDGDGGDFRYITNQEGISYFNRDILQIMQPLQYFLYLSNTDFELKNKPKGRFEFNTSSLRTLGQISTDYDESICLILEGIKEKELSINNVYLPLVYLIRHSIELSLKQNLLHAGNRNLDSRYILKVKTEHSICKLFNMFDTVIRKALNNLSESIEEEIKFRNETENFHRDLESLEIIIHNMDTNSYYYRFPTDRKGQIHNLTITNGKLVKILKLWERTNAYLTLAIPVLQEYGYIEYNDDESF